MQIKILNYIKNNILTNLTLAVVGAVCGVITGSITAVFGRVLLYIGDFRTDNLIYCLPLLALAGIVIVVCYQKFGKGTDKGMGLVFDATNGKEEKIPLRLIPMITLSTWLTHLYGGSAGREGVAVQIGATVSHSAGRFLKPINKIPNATKILAISGMAAGFSGLFHTPVAAVLFAMEILTVGKLEYKALFPAICSSLTSYIISCSLGLETFTFKIANGGFSPVNLKIAILAICFGLAGLFFTKLLSVCKKLFSKLIGNPILRIAIIGVVLSVSLFLCFDGRYTGLGTNLINAGLTDNVYNFDFALKILFTVITLSAGFQGGEVTPLFAIGSTLGAFMGSVLGLPVPLCASLGYAAVFGSATNTLLAPVFIGAEVFGYENMPYFVVVCTIAYLCNFNQSIYGKQKRLN